MESISVVTLLGWQEDRKGVSGVTAKFYGGDGGYTHVHLRQMPMTRTLKMAAYYWMQTVPQ